MSIDHRPSVMSQSWDLGMSGYAMRPMSIGLPRCHDLASGRRTPPRRGRCTPVSPALDVAASPVSGRRTGYDTGVRYGAWDATPVFARRPPGPRPGSDLRRGRRVAAPPWYRLRRRPTRAARVVTPPGGQGGGGQGYRRVAPASYDTGAP